MKPTFGVYNCVLILAGCLQICSPVLYAQAVLQVGFSQVEITPPTPGYPHYRGISSGVDDPLMAKAMVVKQGQNAAALVVCDLLWISRELSVNVRKKAAGSTGIPFANIIVSATHTHTSPAYDEAILVLNAQMRPPSQPSGQSDAYPDWLGEKIAQAVYQAVQALEPVTVRSGTTKVDNLAFNRRFRMANGQVKMNPGAGNKEALEPVGPTDPEMGIAMFERKKDRVQVGAVSNFALHADTYGGTKFSADYPGVMAAALKAGFPQGFVSLFAPGACGNLNHVDVRNPERKKKNAEIGYLLADHFRKAVPELQETGPRLGVLSVPVYVPLQAYTREELHFAYHPDTALYPDPEFLKRRRIIKIRSLETMRKTEAIPPAIGTEPWILPLEVQVISLGKELAVVALPGELFTELGLAIKQQSPFRTTLIVELANTHIAYVPTRQGFTEGGYEAINSRLHPGGGEALVDAAAGALRKLASE